MGHVDGRHREPAPTGAMERGARQRARAPKPGTQQRFDWLDAVGRREPRGTAMKRGASPSASTEGYRVAMSDGTELEIETGFTTPGHVRSIALDYMATSARHGRTVAGMMRSVSFRKEIVRRRR